MYDGLVFEIKFLPLKGRAQAASQVLALLKQKQHRAIEGTRAAATFPLGRIKRDVRSFHQRLFLGSMLRSERNADAGSHEQRDAVYDKWLLERVDQCPGEALGLARLPLADLDDGKLVSGIAIGGVSVTQHAADSTRRKLEQCVAGSMPERVIDRLEIIEVDLQQGDLFPPLVDRRQRFLQALAKSAAVLQSGQRIMRRLMEQEHMFLLVRLRPAVAHSIGQFKDAHAADRAEKQSGTAPSPLLRRQIGVRRQATLKHMVDFGQNAFSEEARINVPDRGASRAELAIKIGEVLRTVRQLQIPIVEGQDVVGVRKKSCKTPAARRRRVLCGGNSCARPRLRRFKT